MSISNNPIVYTVRYKINQHCYFLTVFCYNEKGWLNTYEQNKDVWNAMVSGLLKSKAVF
jgi:hypothetical protein